MGVVNNFVRISFNEHQSLCMVRRLLVLLIATISCTTVFAQKTTVYTEADRNYRLGLELLDKQKYGAARKAFEQTLYSTESISDEARMNSTYYIGWCAAELYQTDAEYLLLGFIQHYPESPKMEEAYFSLGNYYYRAKKYKKSLEWFSRLDLATLDKDERDEVNFKIGYSAYMTEDYDKASRAFFDVKDGDSKYATAAQYYYAHMAYVSENYETALKEFLKLRNSEAFAPVAPYYITQIYYKQGKYDEVLKYAPNALDSAGARNGMEIARMVAESHYRKGEYTTALPYLTDYEKNSPNAGASDYYAIAYSYYRTNQFEKAIPYFQKLTAVEDSLSQNAYYHLGDCFIHTNNKRSARNAYQSAAKMTFDPFITEESRFAYAKLSYELSFQSVAIEACRSFVKDYPESQHVAETNEILINIYASTRNYRDALIALDAIKTKTPGMKVAYQKVAYFRGIELFMDNKLQDAIKMFQTSLANPVDNRLTAEANYWKGEAYYKLGQYEQAVRSYNDFLFMPSAVTSEHYNLANYNAGYANFKLESYANSQTAFRKYIKDKPHTDPQRYSDALLRIADCSFMLRDQNAALDFYSQAIQSGAKASDYAYYQRGIILGVQGKLNEKIASLEKLIEQYPTSVYLDDALYETGQAHLTIDNNGKALTYFSRVINEFPSSSYVKKAELGEALVYYNEGKDEQATAACKRIISKYPNSNESREALSQLKNISVSQHKVDDYLAYVKEVPNADLSTAGQDSIVYEAAELLYTQGKCEEAQRDFDNYLSKYPNAVFKVNANYYRSDCLYRSKKYEEALPGYEYVIAQPKNSFTEKSLLNDALIQFRLKRYEEAAQRFDALEKSAEVKDNITAAQIGQLRAYYKIGKCDRALIAAGKLLANTSIDKDLQNEAQLITGRCYLAEADFAKSKAAFSVVAKRTNSEMTAESKYSLALIEYKQQNYKESQKLIFEVQKQVPSYDFWIAKSFILLGDDYLALKDTFQARETYKSIVDNFERESNEQEDLKQVAQQKLDAINQSRDAREKELLDEKRRLSGAGDDSLEVNPIK